MKLLLIFAGFLIVSFVILNLWVDKHEEDDYE